MYPLQNQTCIINLHYLSYSFIKPRFFYIKISDTPNKTKFYSKWKEQIKFISQITRTSCIDTTLTAVKSEKCKKSISKHFQDYTTTHQFILQQHNSSLFNYDEIHSIFVAPEIKEKWKSPPDLQKKLSFRDAADLSLEKMSNKDRFPHLVTGGCSAERTDLPVSHSIACSNVFSFQFKMLIYW